MALTKSSQRQSRTLRKRCRPARSTARVNAPTQVLRNPALRLGVVTLVLHGGLAIRMIERPV